MSLKTAIQRRKAAKGRDEPNLRSVVKQEVAALAELFFQDMKEELLDTVKQEIKTLTSTVKKGDTGAPGRDGKDGKTPRLGVDYLRIPRDGRDGSVGPKGDKGDRGEAILGPQGFRGKDGSPDTPEEIRDKLQSLQGNKRLDKSAIKGLEEKFDDIIREMRQRSQKDQRGGGGGGLSQLQHESKSVGSGTTTVATNSKIAGGGFAIWAFYNGQLIMRGTHYTVGGDQKTLTLLFTPDDATTIDILYFRT